MKYIEKVAQLIAVTAICFVATTSVVLNAMEIKANQWQLISFPRLPNNPTVDSVFGEAASNGQLTSVWTFDNNTKEWTSWPEQPGLDSSSLSELNVGQGYWVKSSQNINLELTDATEAVGEMVLYPGWNLIGLSVDQTMNHEQALAGVPFLELWKFDANQNKFLSVQKSRGSQIILKEEFTQVAPGSGLWVYMAEQSSLLPSMGTLLPPDVDIEPLLNLTEYGKQTAWDNVTPGDIDWDEDGYFDFPNTQHVVSFGDFLNRQRISITNEGNGVLSWQATIEPAVDWLLFEAFDEDDKPVLTNFAVGNVSNTHGELILVANRTGMAPSDNYKTQIVLRANGSNQEKRIDVYLAVADVVGDYEMTVRLDDVNGKQADLHNPKYFLSFARDGEGVKAFLDEERSLLIPQITYLSGDYVADPESHFQVLGQLYLPADHEHNPYENDIRREFTIIGQRSDGSDGLSPLDLKGTYAENVYGIFDEPIQLSGEFVARRLSPIPKKKDQSISDSVLGDILAGDPESPVVSTFEINVTDRLSMTDVQTALQIDHLQPEALTLTLKGPEWVNDENETVRTTVVLHDEQTRSLKDVRFDEYDPSIGSMDVYDGQLSYGSWTLEISNASTSVGHLRSWLMDISGAKVYQLTGTLPDAGVRIQISGCGVVQSAVTDENGHFVFDGLIPCDYELKVLQLGYDITSTNVRIVGCMQYEICDPSKFVVELTADQLRELEPVLITSSGSMKVVVSPSASQLPVTIQAVDVTDYSHADINKTLLNRTWELYKTVNSWSAISDEGYLVDVEGMGELPPLGSNYISYSEDYSQWNHSNRITLASTNEIDPRGGNNAIKAIHDGSGSAATILNSQDLGEGSFNVSEGDIITLSVFAKPGTSNEIRLRFADASSDIASEILDITTGEHKAGGDLASSTRALANGWYRVAVSFEADQDYAEFNCSIWFAHEGTYEVTTSEDIYLFGPQCEIHNEANALTAITSGEQTTYVLDNHASGYIATNSEHGSRSLNNKQDVLIARKSSGTSASWVYKLENQRELAGLYYVKLQSDVEDQSGTQEELTYQTDLISAYLANLSSIYVATYSTYGAAGSSSVKAMDTATFDIDRFPLMSESGSQGIEDSDGFKLNDIEDDAYETNAPNDVTESSPGVYTMTPTGIDEKRGDLNQHYRMYISAGQLYQGGSMYSGNVRLDVGLQSQEESK